MSARVAVVQAGSVLFAREECVEKACGLVAQAASRGAKLVVFPEAFIGGYPKGMDFGARVGMRSDEGRKDFRRYFENAVEAPGPAVDWLGAAAQDHQVYLVIGVIERDPARFWQILGSWGPDGVLLGKHRKLMPTGMERLIWGTGDGSTLPVLATPVGRIGAVICWENYMPLLRAAMYQKGVQIYCAPTVDDRDTWIPSVRHIALEGRCFVLSACQYVDGLIRGGSAIISPMGKILAGPDYSGETILVADLDLGEIAEGKFDLDVAGHYARPDVFRLVVNEKGGF